MAQDHKQKHDLILARRARLIGMIIVITVILWIAAQYFAARLNLSANTALLFDLMALAGFAWALVHVFWLWRARQQK